MNVPKLKGVTINSSKKFLLKATKRKSFLVNELNKIIKETGLFFYIESPLTLCHKEKPSTSLN